METLPRGVCLDPRLLYNFTAPRFGVELPGAQWEDVKRNIAAEQIRELYKVIASLWPPNTDLLLWTPKNVMI